MPNLTITNIDNGTVIIQDAQFRDELLTMAGADELLEGTILARDSVSLKLVLFVKGGVTNENGIPKAILTYPLSVAGAGDESIRAGVAGVYRLDKLVIDADGDASNVDNAVIDELRDYGLTPLDVSELNIVDNQ